MTGIEPKREVAAHSASDQEDLTRFESRSEHPLAKLLSLAFGPTASIVLSTAIVSAVSADSPVQWAGYTAWVALWTVLLPLAWLWLLIRFNRVDDPHLLLRSKRMPVVAGALVSIVVGAAATVGLAFPLMIAWYMLTVLMILTVIGIITLGWKISFHTSSVSASYVTMATVFPPLWYVVVPVVLAVSWARVTAGRHSVAQVGAGALVGSGLAFSMWQIFNWM